MADGRAMSPADPQGYLDTDYLLGPPSRGNSLSRSPPPSYGSVVEQTDHSTVPKTANTSSCYNTVGNFPSDSHSGEVQTQSGSAGTAGNFPPSSGAQPTAERPSSLIQKHTSWSSPLSSTSPPSEHAPDVSNPQGFGLPDHLVFRARLLSALVLTVYMAAYIGASPLTSQYVYLRLMPDYVNDSSDSDNSTADLSPCTANASDPRVEAMAELQGAVAEMFLYFSLASTGPMILAAIVMGSYSDVIGRRFLFLVPTVGGLLKIIITAVIIKLELSLNYFYAVNVLEGFSGSFAGLLLATYAYTADLTAPAKSRTLAIAILEACLAIAGAGSDIGVGYLILVRDGLQNKH
ncbi:proton-coupled folate transporter-like [Littorina saxatilis]|uniref:Major facilitator superfamily (MFS) profile domain-containing protein n=1 Tax=Littorina saxatilis TaxID=31220 RepID=A0AAN9ALN8_9CAEN